MMPVLGFAAPAPVLVPPGALLASPAFVLDTDPHKNSYGLIVGIAGGLGSGKTMFMSLLGLGVVASGLPVYANYPTTFSKTIGSIPELMSLSNCVILLDELHGFLDSRSFQKNVALTHWITVLRHRKVSLIYATQSVDQIDVRLRNLTYRFVLARGKLGAGKSSYYFIDPETGRVYSQKTLIHDPRLLTLYNTYQLDGLVLTNDGNTSITDPGRLKAAPQGLRSSDSSVSAPGAAGASRVVASTRR